MPFCFKQSDNLILLNAQAHLQTFYGRLGYQSQGDLFDEDGIPHIHDLTI